MIKLYIEDLIASSFITYRININPFKRIYKLSLKQIINFGEHVIDELNKNGFTSMLIASQDQIERFFHKYPDWFRLDENDVVILDVNVTLQDLINKFAGYLNKNVVKAFNNRDNYMILRENEPN